MRGQALVLTLVLMPLLLLIFGVLSRTGGTVLFHDRIENHCDKKVLDALARQGEALEALGKINFLARTVINTRRIVDAMLAASVFYFYAIPGLLKMRRACQNLQKIIDKLQKTIKGVGITQSILELHRQTPLQFRGRIRESYKPLLPILHIKEDQGYEGETGAPLEPDEDFSEKQTAQGKIEIFTEKFLWSWPQYDLKKSLKAPHMALICKARIEMERLEEKWQVQLVRPLAGKLSSN